jgi:hypothetical protein
MPMISIARWCSSMVAAAQRSSTTTPGSMGVKLVLGRRAG